MSARRPGSRTVAWVLSAPRHRWLCQRSRKRSYSIKEKLSLSDARLFVLWMPCLPYYAVSPLQRHRSGDLNSVNTRPERIFQVCSKKVENFRKDLSEARYDAGKIGDLSHMPAIRRDQCDKDLVRIGKVENTRNLPLSQRGIRHRNP
jgi:hypothetical protein